MTAPLTTTPPHAGAAAAVGSDGVETPDTVGPLSRAGARAVAAFVLGAGGVGLIAGVVWRALVRLPAYRLDDASHALIAERGLAAIFATDAWFALLGVVVGWLAGIGAWVFFRRWEWRVVPLAVIAAGVAAVVCWVTGELLGPGPLQRRLARAEVGDVVPIDFQLHAYTALALWPGAAMLPLVMAAALASEPRAARRSARAGATDGGSTGDVGNARAD